MIRITHLAHAGFLIENDTEKLIIDPPDNSFGYEIINENVNYLLVSHEHWDHNNINDITVIDNKGSFVVDKIASYHDRENGSLRGLNTIHVIRTENIKICHLGDLGHPLTDEQIKLIGNVDILLIPVGGVFTINSSEALEVVEKLKPNVIVPMHYKTDKWNSDKDVEPVDNFIEGIENYKIVKMDTNYFDYEKQIEKLVYIV